jgi:hypothetical protein
LKAPSLKTSSSVLLTDEKQLRPELIACRKRRICLPSPSSSELVLAFKEYIQGHSGSQPSEPCGRQWDRPPGTLLPFQARRRTLEERIDLKEFPPPWKACLSPPSQKSYWSGPERWIHYKWDWGAPLSRRQDKNSEKEAGRKVERVIPV